MFHLPITTLAWRRIGVEPLILLISSNQTRSKLAKKTLEYLDKLKATTMHIQVESGYERLAAMTSRLFVGLLPDSMLRDDDFAMSSDSDLYPINREYYKVGDNEQRIKVWNAFCCGTFHQNNRSYTMHPLGHVGK